MIARRLLFTGTILLTILALVGGCSPKPTTQPEEAPAPTAAPSQEPVVLRVGGLQDVDCWNPFSCTAIYMWGDLVLEGFVDQGPSSEGCSGTPAIA